MKIRKATTNLALFFLIVVVINVHPVQAQEPSAAWLLQYVSNAARQVANKARYDGRGNDAQIWMLWANRYQALANSYLMQQTPLSNWLIYNINAHRQMAILSEQYSLPQYARFYRTYASFWQDIANQLQQGIEPTFRFPIAMLEKLPGAPSTPWESTANQLSTPGISQQISCEGLRQMIARLKNDLEDIESRQGQTNILFSIKLSTMAQLSHYRIQCSQQCSNCP